MHNRSKRLSKSASRALSALLCLSVSMSGWPVTAEAADSDFNLNAPAAPTAGAVSLVTSCLAQSTSAPTASWSDLLGATVFKSKNGKVVEEEADDDYFYSELGLPDKIDMATKCPAAAGGITEKPRCEDLDSSEDLENIKKTNLAAVRGYACHVLQADTIMGELNCLKGAIQSVEQNINQMKSQFTPILTQAVADLKVADSMIKDRESQREQIYTALQGDGNTGKKGLLAIKQELEGLAKSLPSEAVAARQAVEKFENTKQRVEVLIQQNKMSLAMDCFTNKPMANYRCTKNGPIVSAKEYLLCRFEQSQYVAKGGKVVVNSANQKRAAARKESLSKLLDQIIGEAPKLSRLPATNDKDGFEATIQSYLINKPADVTNRYGSYLKNMEGPGGIPVESFVRSSMAQCYNEASRTVEKQRTDPNSQITQLQKTVRAQEEQMQAQMKGKILDYSSKYAEAVKGNTGLELPMSTNACLQGSPTDQASCIQALSNALNTVLTGNVTETEKSKLTPAAMALTGGKAPYFGFNQQFTATNAALAFKLECRGVNGCVAAMQAKETELKNLVQDTKQKKEMYQTNVNNMITKQAQNVGQAFSQVSGALRQRMDQLSKAFISAGIGGALKLEDRKVDLKSVRPDETTGIYDANDIDQLVYANTSPPLLTLDMAGFAAAEERLSDQKKENAQKMKEIASVLASIDTVKAACQRKSSRDLAKTLCEPLLARCEKAEQSREKYVDLMGSANDAIALLQKQLDRIEAQRKIASKDNRQSLDIQYQEKADALEQKQKDQQKYAGMQFGMGDCDRVQAECTGAIAEGGSKDFIDFLKRAKPPSQSSGLVNSNDE